MDVTRRLRKLVRDEEGQDLLEYALLVALIALVVLAAIDEAGEQIAALYTHITTTIASA